VLAEAQLRHEPADDIVQIRAESTDHSLGEGAHEGLLTASI
jgi:hypothetical protein